MPRKRKNAVAERVARARAQERQLDESLSKFTPSLVTEDTIRGIGVVTPPRKVKFSRPRHVRRSEGYIASNGAWIATPEAGYLEFSKDVGRRRKAKIIKTQVTTTTTHSARSDYFDRLAKFGTTDLTQDV